MGRMEANEFKEWRDKRGWTQVQAAEQLGISRASLIRYEHGDYPIPRTVMLACKALEDEQT